jgi:hypothetical protein
MTKKKGEDNEDRERNNQGQAGREVETGRGKKGIMKTYHICSSNRRKKMCDRMVLPKR